MRTIENTRGPLDPLRAAAAIEDASDRDQIFDLLLRAARSKLGYAAILTVHADRLRGWGEASSVELSRDVPSFESALALTSPAVGPIATGESFLDGMLDQLGGSSRCVMLLPVCVRMRPLALLVGHRGDELFAPADIADLFPLLDAADAALARVLSTRAMSAAERAPTRADTEYDLEVIHEESRVDHRAALAEHRRAQAWPEVAATIRELIRDGVDTGDPGEEEQLELLLELGSVEAERLGRPEAAIQVWRSAQAIDGSDERVLDALEALFAKLGRWADCVELLERRVALTAAQAPRITMLKNLAAIAREHLNDPGRAIEAYERILAWEAGDTFASAQLEELYRARQEWEPLAAQMLDRASRDPDPIAASAALAQVAEMYEHQVGDPRAALLVWLTVLRRDPTRISIVDELERLARAANAWEEITDEAATAADALEVHPVAAAALWQLVGTWARVRLANRERAIRAFENALRVGPGDPERESQLNIELAELHEGLPALAIEYYERALESRPDALAPRVALHRHYLAGGHWAELAELLPRLIDALAPSAQVGVVVDLHVELGGILADHLNRPDDAVRVLQDALALDPKHAEALRRIADVYEATGQAEALLEVTEAEVDAAPLAVKARRYADIAAAWHEHGKLDRAAAAWQKLIAIEPKSAIGQQGLARTLRADGRWVELVGALRAQSVQAPGSYDRLVLLELADVLETKLDDVSGATATLEEITAREPDDPAALDALARLHDRAGRLRPALDALERLLAQTSDVRARADLLQRVAQIHLTARDAPAARLSLVQSLALDRENPRTREAMARVHLQQGELVAAGEELRRAARLSTSTDGTLRCLADAAWLYRHRLGDAERARECLHQILELDPAHADAKQALAELLHDNREWESLWPHLEAEVARARVDATVAPAARAELYAKAARCAVELGNLPLA
ncbi:MAG: tetratricopeptide repeat protein, partial [Deltaproteobacteria bacterium]|nr:tetratricopeptide repeat protein [Deltaproteobacteria bacterium]